LVIPYRKCIGPISKGQEFDFWVHLAGGEVFMTLEDGADRFSRNVGKELSNIKAIQSNTSFFYLSKKKEMC
jgi:hypothetical protein